MRTALTGAAGVLAALFVAIQLVTVEQGNPPVEQEVPAKAETRAVLKRAC